MRDDLYRVLNVDARADTEAIRAAYRRLARLYHPDVNAAPAAATRMRAINAAYAVLSDPQRRAAYDARRFLGTAPTSIGVGVPVPVPASTMATAPPMQRVGVSAPPPGRPPTALQRRVDRIVAIVGVLLLVAIGIYTINVIPYADQQIQNKGPAPVATGDPSATDHAVGGDVADHLRKSDDLHDFPGAVLVPPARLQPFAGLPILRVEGTSRGIARYAVYYGDLTTGGASVSGLVGRDALDHAVPRVADCAADAAYCVGPAPGQSSGPAGLELFRGPDVLGEYPGFVTHRVCCNGVFWSVSWYEARSNMTYTIDLSRNVAARYGTPTADGDSAAARAVAALARQLVRLP